MSRRATCKFPRRGENSSWVGAATPYPDSSDCCQIGPGELINKHEMGGLRVFIIQQPMGLSEVGCFIIMMRQVFPLDAVTKTREVFAGRVIKR